MTRDVTPMDPAPGPQAAPRTSHLDAGAFGDVSASVSLFQAALALPLTMASVPGRDGLDLKVTAFYGSGSARAAEIWNLDAPTGVLGLGWSLSADRIVVDGKTSRNPLDGRFLLQSGGTLDPLVWYGSDGGTLLFQCASHPLWRIRYEAAVQTWTVLRDDGTTAVYGGPGGDAVIEGVMWGNWVGGSRAESADVHRYPVAWNLAEVRTPGGSAMTWHYAKDEVAIADGLTYTRASYPVRLAGPDGGSIDFHYAAKEAAEFVPPHQTATGQADPSYQDRYEDRYLDSLDVRAGSETDDLHYTLRFEYEVRNVSGSASSAYTKRFLTAIRQERHGRLDLPATRFAYETDPQAASPGALTSILFPEGGVASVSYQTVTLGPGGVSGTRAGHYDPDDVFRTTIKVLRPAELPGAVPLVFQGPDYVVVAWYSEPAAITEVHVYTVGGRWSEPWIVQIQGQIRTEYARFAGTETFFALYLPTKTGTGKAAVHLFRKDPHRFGEWTGRSEQVDRTTTEIPAESTLAAGRDFAVLHVGGERQVHRFWWDPVAADWERFAQGPGTTKIALAARGEYYAVAWYDLGTKTATYQLFHLEATAAWKAGDPGPASLPFDWDPRYAGEFWALGDSFAVGTYVRTGNERRLRILQWDADFTETRNSDQLGGADRSQVVGALVGNGSLVLRYDGTRWHDFDFGPTTQNVRYAYGEDLVVRSVVDGTTTEDSAARYVAATGEWILQSLPAGGGAPGHAADSGHDTPGPHHTAGHHEVQPEAHPDAHPDTGALAPAVWPPSSSGRLTSAGSTVRWRSPDGTLGAIGSLPELGAAGSLHNVGPSHLIYQNDPIDRGDAETTVLVLRDGVIGQTVRLPHERITVDDARVAVSQMAGARVFVTYPAQYVLATAPELHLHRIIDRSLTAAVTVPVVSQVSIDSGQQILTTGYEYDTTRAVFDTAGTAVLFPKATRVIGAGGAGGRAEYAYHNGLRDDAASDTDPYSLYTGMLSWSRTFDADGYEVAASRMSWTGLAVQSGTASPVGVALHAVLPILTRTEATVGRLSLFPLPLTQIPALDAGTLSEEARAAFAAAGLPLGPQARVVVGTAGTRWDVVDAAAAYPVGREHDAYGAPADELWVYGSSQRAYTNAYDPATGLLIGQESTEYFPDGTPHTVVRALTPAWRVPEYAGLAAAGMYQQLAAEQVADTTTDVCLSAVQSTYRQDWPDPAPRKWAQYESWTWRGEGDYPPPFSRAPGADRSAWILGERYTARNRFGNPIVSVDAMGLATSTLYDLQDRRVVATFVNLDVAAPAPAGCCLGFEPYERTQGWRREDGQSLETLTTTDYPHTGSRCLRLPGDAGVVAEFELPQDSGTAFFSCWVRTDPGFIPDEADGWTFELRAAGGEPTVVRLPFPATDGAWQRIQTGLHHPDPAAATVATCRAHTRSGVVAHVDDLRLVPLEGGVSATVYAGDTRLPLAELDINNAATRMHYDSSLRLVAASGPDTGSLRGLGGFAYSRGSDDDPRGARAAHRPASARGHHHGGADAFGGDAFDQTVPNARTTFAALDGGDVEEFPGRGDWQARWAPAPAGAWTLTGRALRHTGSGTGTLTLRGSEEMSWYGVRVDVEAGADQAGTAAAIAVGDVAATWDPAGVWVLTRGGAEVARAAGPRPESADWTLVAQPHTVLLLLDGRQILAHRFAEPVGGALVLTAGGAVAGFTRLTVFHRPTVDVSYTDGVGIERQRLELTEDGVTVAGALPDALGRPATRIKAMAYAGRVPGFVGGYVTGMDPADGRLTGDVAEYYDGTDGRSDDGGYPYTRSRLEMAVTNRPLETGQAGAVHAIAPGATHTVRTRHGLNVNDGFLDHLPAGRYPTVTTTDADGRVETTVQDPAARDLGVRQAPGAEDVRTAYVYDRRGDVVRILGPDHFAPRPDQDPEAGTVEHEIDGLGRIIGDAAADTGRSESVYDDRGNLRFARYADGHGTAPGGLDRVVYHTYDRLGRRIETGEIVRVFDRAELQALAGARWPLADPGWRERLEFDGDGSVPNAVGRGRVWSRTVAPGGPAVSTTLEYDAAGRTVRSLERGGDEPAWETRYTFHPGGQLARIDYPGQGPSTAGPAVCQSYDVLGRVVGIGTPEDAHAYASYGYTSTGALAYERLGLAGPGGTVRRFDYNSPGLLSAAESRYFTERVEYWEEAGDDGHRYYGGQASRASFEAPEDGGAVPSAYSWLYSYSDAGRLRTARNTGGPEYDFGVGGPAEFDANGNLLHVHEGGVERTYAYDPRGNRLTAHNGADGFAYDAAGRTTATPDPLVRALGTDRVLGLPSSVTAADGSRTDLVAGGSGARRWSRTRRDAGGTVLAEHQFLSGAGAGVLTERHRAGASSAWQTTNYIYGVGGLVAVLTDDGTEAAVFRDRIGSSRLLVSAAGEVLGRYDYRPYGEPLGTPAGTRPDLLRRRFLGQDWDPDTGLVDLGLRLYHPGLCRFYDPDPAGTGTNPYPYAGGDPVNMVDPGGDFFFIPIIVAILVGAAVGAATGAVTAKVQGASGMDIAKQAGIGAAVGAVTGVLSLATAGAVAGAIAAVVPTMEAVGASAFAAVARGVGTAAITGAIDGAVTGGVGQIMTNVLDGKSGMASLDGVGVAVGFGAAVGMGTYALGSLMVGARLAYQRSAQRVVTFTASEEVPLSSVRRNNAWGANPNHQSYDWSDPHLYGIRNPADGGSRLEIISHGTHGGDGMQWTRYPGDTPSVSGTVAAGRLNAAPAGLAAAGPRFKFVDLIVCDLGSGSFAQDFATASQTLTRASTGTSYVGATGKWVIEDGYRQVWVHPDPRVTGVLRLFGY